jgi:hypothetical protein
VAGAAVVGATDALLGAAVGGGAAVRSVARDGDGSAAPVGAGVPADVVAVSVGTATAVAVTAGPDAEQPATTKATTASAILTAPLRSMRG